MTSADFFKFLPDFYRNIREYDCIFTAVANKLNRIEEKRKQEKANLFIYSEDIDEEGVDRLGKSLKIDLAGLDFEDKVFKIKTALFDKRPYNRTNTDSMLLSLCGKDGYLLEIDAENKSVSAKVDLGRKNQFAAVYNLLNNVVPANMILNVDLLYNLHGDLTGITHGELSAKTHEELRSDVL